MEEDFALDHSQKSPLWDALDHYVINIERAEPYYWKHKDADLFLWYM